MIIRDLEGYDLSLDERCYARRVYHLARRSYLSRFDSRRVVYIAIAAR